VLIVVRVSLSVLPNRNSLPARDLPTNPSVVCAAGRKRKISEIEAGGAIAAEVDIRGKGKCMLLFALSAVRKQKYRSNPGKGDRFIAAIATLKEKFSFRSHK